MVAFIDAEHALDPTWARASASTLKRCWSPNRIRVSKGLEICELLVRSNATNVIVVDSVAALIPKAEIEGEMGDSHVGLQARLMSQAMRKLTGAINRSDCTVIFINQIREKIGVMFGSPETTTGGRALKFYSSVRIDIRRIGSIKDGDKAIGNHRAARWSKTRSHRHSNKPSSTSCSTKAFRGAATCWTWPSSKASVKRVVRGSLGETCMGQAGKPPSNSFATTPRRRPRFEKKFSPQAWGLARVGSGS